MFAPGLQLKVTLPAARRPDLYCPNDEDIKKLLQSIQGTELEKAVLLAAFAPLRRGEISALDATCIKGNTVTVKSSMVLDENKIWVIKQPKTGSSYRTVEMPTFVMEKIATKKGRVVNLTPNQITQQFGRKLKQLDVPHFRFHDLRHPYVKHTTKKYNSEKQKTQATKIVDLIAWGFCFCIVSYSKRSWTL